jgi:monoterpene epsilon-lactone hydrolase
VPSDLAKEDQVPSEAMQQVVSMLEAFDVHSRTASPVAEQRAAYELAGAAYPLPDGCRVERFQLGAFPAEWVSAGATSGEPSSASKCEAGGGGRSVLYLHGGGYVIGSCNTHRELATRLSAACDAPVLLPEYRLAPESPFPAAVEDAVACYRFLLGSTDPSSIAVGGDSAGGGLALALLLSCRREGLPLPGACFLLSPWCDLTLSGSTIDAPREHDPVVSRDFLELMAAHYLAGHDPSDPLTSPLFGDLTGLPPMLVQVGTAEVLLDDSLRLADKARKAGVDASLHVFDGAVHVFQAFAAQAPESEEALREIGEFVKMNLARQAV